MRRARQRLDRGVRSKSLTQIKVLPDWVDKDEDTAGFMAGGV
jgi:hypothetical protein